MGAQAMLSQTPRRAGARSTMSAEGTVDRFRVLCNVCLVFDSLFLLLYFTTVLQTISRASRGPLASCYQEAGWTWHFTVGVALLVSAGVALGGVVTHSLVVCLGTLSVSRVKSVSTYATMLCCWILLSSVIQAISYKQDTCALL